MCCSITIRDFDLNNNDKNFVTGSVHNDYYNIGVNEVVGEKFDKKNERKVQQGQLKEDNARIVVLQTNSTKGLKSFIVIAIPVTIQFLAITDVVMDDHCRNGGGS